MTLRELAEGKPCMVRVPGVCNCDPRTTVLAHIRRAHVAGVGHKPPDTCAVFACSACHDEIDRRTRRLPSEMLADILLDALCRQLAWYDRHQVLVIAI